MCGGAVVLMVCIGNTAFILGLFGELVETDGNTDFSALSLYTSMPVWICL